MDKLIALFEYIGKHGICSSETTPFTINDFIEVEDKKDDKQSWKH